MGWLGVFLWLPWGQLESLMQLLSAESSPGSETYKTAPPACLAPRFSCTWCPLHTVSHDSVVQTSWRTNKKPSGLLSPRLGPDTTSPLPQFIGQIQKDRILDSILRWEEQCAHTGWEELSGVSFQTVHHSLLSHYSRSPPFCVENVFTPSRHPKFSFQYGSNLKSSISWSVMNG